MHDQPTNDTIEQIITNLSDSMNIPTNIFYHFDGNADNQFSKHDNISIFTISEIDDVYYTRWIDDKNNKINKCVNDKV